MPSNEVRHRTIVALFSLSLYFLVFPVTTSAEETNTCFSDAGPATSGEVAGYTWKIKPIKDRYLNCLGEVWSPSKQLVFRAKDHHLSLESISGHDVNGDGQPDLVFVGYSGGAHCCWTYWIISLGDHGGLIAKIYNQSDISFEPTGPNNRIEMWTYDGSFDYFDHFRLSHTESVFPEAVLRLEGKTVRDVSAEHLDEYDSRIAEARKKLTPEAAARWKNANPADVDIPGYEDPVLTIVFAYLYSGRPDEAWRSLDCYWPVEDSGRIKKVILANRRKGVLHYTQPGGTATGY